MTKNVGPEDRIVRIVIALGLGALLYLGIIEDTAAIVTDGVMEVAGKGAVTVLDARDAISSASTAKASRPILVSGVVVHVLPAGARFDLTSRSLYEVTAPLPSAERAEIEATEAGMRRLARRVAREDASPVRLRAVRDEQQPAHSGNEEAP